MSTERDDGGPAFPEPGMTGLPNGEFIYGQPGMCLRDYLAAKAMQGLCACGRWNATHHVGGVAKSAYEIADAMLEARK